MSMDIGHCVHGLSMSNNLLGHISKYNTDYYHAKTLGFGGEDARPRLLGEDTRSQLLGKDTKPQLLGEDTRPQLLDKSKTLLLDDDTGSLFIMRPFPAHNRRSRPFNTTSVR